MESERGEREKEEGGRERENSQLSHLNEQRECLIRNTKRKNTHYYFYKEYSSTRTEDLVPTVSCVFNFIPVKKKKLFNVKFLQS